MTVFRSTKGASKARRDLINAEILNLRDMLPLPDAARQRLSQLQIMSLACVFIRKTNYFSKLFGGSGFISESPFEFSQAMAGFLLITTREGKLLHISENVTEYLGHSMVDMMTQGDSIYDIIDKRDHATVQAQLVPPTSGTGQEGDKDFRSFFCRMNVARSFRRQAGFGDHKMMHVRGHYVQPMVRDTFSNQPVFMASCTPLITPDMKDSLIQNNTMVFHSVHSLDMKFTELGHTAEQHLGYTEADLCGRSWYEFLHPEELQEAKDKHIQLIKSSHEMGCMLTNRLQTKDGDWIWVNTVMHVRQPFVCDNGDPAIVCINHVIHESESAHYKLQSQMYSSHIARSPEFMGLSQSGSPPQVQPVQVESQFPSSSSSYGSGQSQQQGRAGDPEPVYYRGEFVATQTGTVGGSSNVGIGQSGDTAMPTTRTMSLGDTDSGSNSGGESSNPSDKRQGVLTLNQRQIVRDSILNKLGKRRSQVNQQDGSQNPGCKPAKHQRLSFDDSNGSQPGVGTTNYTASFLAEPLVGDLGGAMQLVGGGGLQLLMPAQETPVYAQLSINSKNLMKAETRPIVMMEQAKIMSPAPPLTPDSSSSESGDDTMTMTVLPRLSISVPEFHLPSSILTPDNSPIPSPTDSITTTKPAGLAEQTVPTHVGVAELDELSLFDECKQKLKPLMKLNQALQPSTPAARTAPATNLPVLDLYSLEDFLSTLEDKSCITAVPRGSQQVHAVQPTPIRPNVAPRRSEVDIKPEPPMSVSAGPESMGSPVSSVTSPGGGGSPYCTEDDQQLQRLVAGVTDAILDIVQQAADGSINLSDLTGFMVVPNTRASPATPPAPLENEQPTPADDSLDEMDFDALEQTLSSPGGDDFLLDELHQLTADLTSAVPSYGECDLAGSILKQSL